MITAAPVNVEWKESPKSVPDGILYDIDARAGAVWAVGLAEKPAPPPSNTLSLVDGEPVALGTDYSSPEGS